MANETYSSLRPPMLGHPWPPDDTEESVVGTDWHQMTIINLRWGLNESAGALAHAGQPLPWHALSQTILTGFERHDGTRYKTMPDIFVYRHPIDPHRGLLSVRVDGPPALIIEVLSEATFESDLDLSAGKGYSYARAGVREYLALDPTGNFVPEHGWAWRLEGGVYRPWERAADGRWHSQEIAAAIGLEGTLAAVYTREGRRQLREGEIARELAQRDEALAQRDEELAALRRLVEHLKQEQHGTPE